MRPTRGAPALLALTLLPIAMARGDSRFYFEGSTLPFAGVDVELRLLGDHDTSILGYSFGIEAPVDVIRLRGVRADGTIGEDADYFGGTIVPGSGVLGYGCVLDFDAIPADALPAGAGRALAKIDVDVVGPPGSLAEVTFPFALTPQPPLPVLVNIYTDAAGRSIDAATTPATFTVVDRRPAITGVSGGAGYAGDTFQVTGENFDAPDLAVRVCGVEAETAPGDGDGTLVVTAPGCPAGGLADVEVCTEFGCASRQGGFEYLPERAYVRGEANGDGDVDLADAVAVALHLFGGIESPVCDDALDADDDGDVALGDAILLASFVVLGEPAIAAPFPQPGADPTEDTLPPCRMP